MSSDVLIRHSPSSGKRSSDIWGNIELWIPDQSNISVPVPIPANRLPVAARLYPVEVETAFVIALVYRATSDRLLERNAPSEKRGT